VLFREGHSASSVAEQLGVALETVVSWRARWRRERAAALFEEGQTPSAVAQRLGIARQPPCAGEPAGAPAARRRCSTAPADSQQFPTVSCC